MEEYCGKCMGAAVLVLGVLVLIKEYLFVSMSWGLFLGLLLIFIGIMRMVKPTCGCGRGCCAPSIEEVRAYKKKRV